MWRSDLRALRNLFRTREGRGVLLGHLIVTVSLGVGALGLGSRVIVSGPLVSEVSGDAGALQQFYFLCLALPLLGVLGLGGAQLGRDLFTARELPLLLTAPVSTLSLLLRVTARTVLGWTTAASAMGIAWTVALASASPVSGAPALVYPLAFALTAFPVVSALVLLQVLRTRYFSHPLVRQAVTCLNVLLCLAVGLALLTGFLRGPEVARVLAEQVQGGFRLGWGLDAPAALLALAAGHGSAAVRTLGVLPWLAGGLLLLLAAARVYRSAVEAHLVEALPSSAYRSRLGAPTTAFRAFLWKSLLECWRVRSNLVFYAVLAVIAVALLVPGPIVAPSEWEERVPLALREGLTLLRSFQGLSLFITTLAFLGVVGGEQDHLALLASAPFERGALLRARLLMVCSPIVVVGLVTGVCAIAVAAHPAGTLGWFVLGALPLTLFSTGLVAAVGTWPSAMRLHDDVPLASNTRLILPVVIVGVLGSVGLVSVVKLRFALSSCYYGHGPLSFTGPGTAVALVYGLLWALGLVVFALGWVLAHRNVERLLGPQAD